MVHLGKLREQIDADAPALQYTGAPGVPNGREQACRMGENRHAEWERTGMPHKRPASPYWWLSITPPGGGKPIRRSTGTVDRKEAEAIEGRMRAQLFQQQHWGREPERLFEDVAAEYLLACSGKRSLSDIKQRVGRLYDHFDGTDMGGLAGQDVRRFIEWRRGHGVSDSSINRELSVLSAMINHAIVHLEWKLPNPLRGRMLREPESRVRWITRAEAASLMQNAR